ncbi:thiamine pyrophosphate-requiring protein [Pararhizobium haloflavum]|uniref:thiamine pyrophosphate-requiring protein n=1 Tax=Pararhizobium haloflavum TaxID=2037914 RepID=UPI000C184DAF|nr:thiamine pyrophosphate-requiring protein [Pararhizobium haloflavum]
MAKTVAADRSGERDTVAGETQSMTAGGALLARMKALGVDYIFANSGTDFPPIIEGLAEAEAKGMELPQALVMPHEAAAMGMAHGYYFATGRAQAVMAHTNVGLANCALGAINAATDHVPMLLFSGRTPTTEKGRLGTRTVPIGWGQEMRDQAALVREACKWDYELRFPEQVVDSIDRAYAIAGAAPRGPVYVSLPREVLCQPCPADGLDAPASITPPALGLHQPSIEQAAKILAASKNPLIIAQRGAGSDAGFAALAAIAERHAIPVCQYWAVKLAIALDHPMAAPFDPAALIEKADAILVIDSLAPWSPDIHELQPGCKVIHLGQDPLYSRFPVRNFRCDLAITADVADGLMALDTALSAADVDSDVVEQRRTRVACDNKSARQAAIARAKAGNGSPMTKDWVSLCLSDAVKSRDASILSELGAPMAPMALDHPRAWYQEPHSGGLGWSFPAALGMQLADRDRLIVATMGDGAYMFANPVACHQIAEALDLPILIVIVNNAEWGAVRHSVLGIYPDGYASKTNRMPLTALSPVPDFTKVAEASRAYARTVTDGADLPDALSEAIRHIEENRTLALLDVRVRP